MEDFQETPYGLWTPNGLVGYQRPTIEVASPFVKTDWDKCKEFLKIVGVVLDPWQEYCMEHALGRNERNSWAARTFGLVVARQQGKSLLMAARILLGLFVLQERVIIYSAHRNDTAHEIFERVAELIEESPALKKRTKQISRTNGRQGVITKNGCKAIFKTRKKDSGRGFSADLLLGDEAMNMDRSWIGDVMPVLSARLNPQLWLAGSAGEETALAFGDFRQRALGDDPGAITWFEWAAKLCNDDCEPGCQNHPQPNSVEAYRQSNPAYGIRISHETIEEEWRAMQALPENFLRERLSIGQWPVDLDEFSVISRDAWEAAKLEANPVGQLIFSVSMKPDLTGTVIEAIGFTDESQKDIVIHVVEESARAGKDWALERILQLNEKWKPYGFAIDSRGQAATLIPELTEKGVTVYSPSSLEYAQACAQFTVGVTGTKKDPRYIHHIGDPALTTAVAGAGQRSLSGLWAWARAHDNANITALEAATLGVWGLKKAVKESTMNQVFFKRAGRR